MGVIFDIYKCIGCGRCAAVCPGNLIKADSSGKAYLKKADSCWSCVSCVKECPVGAISLVLGPEMDGRGAKLCVNKEDNGYKWTVIRNEDELASFVTRSDEANKY